MIRCTDFDRVIPILFSFVSLPVKFSKLRIIKSSIYVVALRFSIKDQALTLETLV